MGVVSVVDFLTPLSGLRVRFEVHSKPYAHGFTVYLGPRFWSGSRAGLEFEGFWFRACGLGFGGFRVLGLGLGFRLILFGGRFR